MVKKLPIKKQGEKSLFFNGLSLVILSAVITITLTGYYYFSSHHFVCANSESCIQNLSGTPEQTTTGIFMNQIVTAPKVKEQPLFQSKVLGETSKPKRIAVDLTTQQLYAFEGDNIAFTFPISSGKWFPTPTGNFRIWIKLRATRMKGGSKALGTYYNLPNVPYTMFFYNDEVPKNKGYGLHGAYWHNNFGHPMSHGCVNISIENAKKLYEWATPVSEKYVTYATDDNPGTSLIIYGEAPIE